VRHLHLVPDPDPGLGDEPDSTPYGGGFQLHLTLAGLPPLPPAAPAPEEPVDDGAPDPGEEPESGVAGMLADQMDLLVEGLEGEERRQAILSMYLDGDGNVRLKPRLTAV
jgi:hypothetical protein